jgi:AcrR family transcriptional regulator
MPESTKREDILKAASHCFAHYGFAKTTMDDIGKMVGLNKTSLYYYYKNKDTIFCEIIRQESDHFLSSLEKKIEGITPWHEKIHTYILERQRHFQNTVNLHKLSIKTSKQLQFHPSFLELLKRFNVQETQIISKILNQAMGKKQIQKMDLQKAQKTASIILSVVYGIKQQQMLLENDNLTLAQFDFKTIEQDTRFAISLILNGLMASPT